MHYFLQIFWWALFWALVNSCFWKRLYNKTCLSQIMKTSNDQKHRSLKFYRRDVKKKSESLQEITSVKFFISSTAGICCVTPRKGILPRPFLRIFFSFGGNRYLTLCLRKIACEWFRARVQIILLVASWLLVTWIWSSTVTVLEVPINPMKSQKIIPKNLFEIILFMIANNK